MSKSLMSKFIFAISVLLTAATSAAEMKIAVGPGKYKEVPFTSGNFQGVRAVQTQQLINVETGAIQTVTMAIVSGTITENGKSRSVYEETEVRDRSKLPAWATSNSNARNGRVNSRNGNPDFPLTSVDAKIPANAQAVYKQLLAEKRKQFYQNLKFNPIRNSKAGSDEVDLGSIRNPTLPTSQEAVLAMNELLQQNQDLFRRTMNDAARDYAEVRKHYLEGLISRDAAVNQMNNLANQARRESEMTNDKLNQTLAQLAGARNSVDFSEIESQPVSFSDYDDAMGEVLAKEASDLEKQKRFIDAADVYSELASPWHDGPIPSSVLAKLDNNGILRGQVFKPNGLMPAGSKSDQYRMIRAANVLQAIAQERPASFLLGTAKTYLEAAVVYLKAFELQSLAGKNEETQHLLRNAEQIIKFHAGAMIGFSQAAVGSVEGAIALLEKTGALAVDLLEDPVSASVALKDSAVQLVKALPGALVHATIDAYTTVRNGNSVNRGGLAGRIVFEVLSNTVGAGATKAGTIAKASDIVAVAEKSASLAKAIKVTAGPVARMSQMSGVAREFVSAAIEQKRFLVGKGAPGDLSKWANTAARLEKSATVVEAMAAKLKAVVPKSESLSYTRFVEEKYLIKDAAGRVITDSGYKFHVKLGEAYHRYSMGGPKGRSGLYASLDAKTATAELKGVLGNFIEVPSSGVVEKMLDLTDPVVLDQLGLRTQDLVETLHSTSAAYEITQAIGFAAEKNGFKAIKFPSAANRGGVNLVFFQ
ncbi:MAG: RES domain-containing protein [Proteobacteria bacterium]|nr:MAG: RES domain-containing protein [Pseudomonadota bacterium]